MLRTRAGKRSGPGRPIIGRMRVSEQPVRSSNDDMRPGAFRVGSAPDSWGVWFAEDPEQTPWKRFLDEVAHAGYEWLELGPYGYLPADPETLRSEFGRR